MLVVGLTGDIGAGKTTLSGLWKRAGAYVINADAVVGEIWEQGSLDASVRKRWGDYVFPDGGKPDHNRIASIVFDDEKEYRWLCGLIHPLVRNVIEGRILSLDGWIVVEIPLLFENGVPWWVDETVYLTASLDLRIARNSSRNWTESEIKRRGKWLLSCEMKKERADYVLNNSGDIEDLEKRATDLASVFRDMASCVTVSVELATKQDTLDFAERLVSENLAAYVNIFSREMVASRSFSASSGRAIGAEAFTIERYVPKIVEIAASLDIKGIFTRAERIRRTAKSLRDWIREACRD